MSPSLIPMGHLPFFAQGSVIRGFGRGSKSLGIPTANFSDDVVRSIPDAMENGVYYGLANIDGGPTSKMVLSVGYNPHFNNQLRTMETHILRHFDADFYGSWMRVAVLGFIRTMQSYPGLDELIAAIHSDIAIAQKEMDRPEMAIFGQHAFFHQSIPISACCQINCPVQQPVNHAATGMTDQWTKPSHTINGDNNGV